MPDISMCVNQDCLVKERCYRYRAIPSEYQSIAFFSPDNNGMCDYYWSITNQRVLPLTDSETYAATVNGKGKESNDV